MQPPPASRETKLLRFLVQNELLSREAAAAAETQLAGQKGELSVLEWLGSQGLIEEEQLATRMAERLRIPYVNLAAQVFERDTLALVREDLATKHWVVPLRQEERSLIVATSNPLDHDAVRAIEFATSRRVRLVIATASGIIDALNRAYHFDTTLSAYLQGVPGDADVPITAVDDEPADLDRLRKQTSLPPVVKLLNLILLDGIRTRASDIHIEATPTDIRVRYRVDGMLQEGFQFPRWVLDSLVARCKVLAKLDITERQRPQDGRIRIAHKDAFVDMRVSSLPTQFGEKVTMRILNSASAPTGLDHLDLSERDLRCVRHALNRPQGMILVTGPTGSGKTTTLYGMLAELRAPTRNIVTIENPIEYRMPGVNQVEINERRGLNFADTLRSVLRQDPDVILVGEIRDQETAQIAVRAAQTGHLVLSTLHTNDSVATITRLTDLGIEPYALAPSLALIAAQRLVRRVCDQCAEPFVPNPDTRRALHLGEGGDLRRGRGCQACNNIGYAGRMAVIEVTAMTPAMTRLIEARAPETALRRQAMDDGTVLLIRHAVRAVREGATTPDEVLRAVDIIDPEPRCPACDETVSERFTVCPHCATPLRLTCSSCQEHLQPGWQTCPYCGAAARKAAPPAEAAPSEPRGGSAGRRDPFKVLIVDDDQDSRNLLVSFLRSSGLPMTCATATSGIEALACVEKQTPDLVLLDIMMPEMDGFEVCAQLRANLRTAFIPVLMLTALADSDSRARGFTVGTDDFVSKPFRRAELLARVRRILERTYGVLPGDELTDGNAPAPSLLADVSAAS